MRQPTAAARVPGGTRPPSGVAPACQREIAAKPNFRRLRNETAAYFWRGKISPRSGRAGASPREGPQLTPFVGPRKLRPEMATEIFSTKLSDGVFCGIESDAREELQFSTRERCVAGLPRGRRPARPVLRTGFRQRAGIDYDFRFQTACAGGGLQLALLVIWLRLREDCYSSDRVPCGTSCLSSGEHSRTGFTPVRERTSNK